MKEVKKSGKPKIVMPKLTNGEWVSISQAHRITGYARSTIYKMIKDNRIESEFYYGVRRVKVGHDW